MPAWTSIRCNSTSSPAAPVAHAPRRRLEVWFEDGSHRFRAYEFLGLREPLDVVLRGEARHVADLLSVAGEGIVPTAPVHLAAA